jgi:hypothetical protein
MSIKDPVSALELGLFVTIGGILVFFLHFFVTIVFSFIHSSRANRDEICKMLITIKMMKRRVHMEKIYAYFLLIGALMLVSLFGTKFIQLPDSFAKQGALPSLAEWRNHRS